MKNLILFCAIAVAFASCATAPAFEQTEEIGPFTVSLIEENVWHVEDCNSSHPAGLSIKEDGSYTFNSCSDMYIIRGKKKALLIDLTNNITWTEGADEALRKIFYDRAGDREKIITITHNHGDHPGMAYAFENEPGIKYMLPVNDFKEDKVFPEHKQFTADRDCIDLGGMVVECVQCEGHTPGSMVFFLKGHNLGFSGDAIGSGTGVWIFSKEGFRQYTNGVENLLSYMEDPKSGIDPATFVLWGGHTYQNSGFELGVQTVRDAKELNDQIWNGTAQWEPYNMVARGLDATFKNGQAMVVWNKAASEEAAAEGR